MKKIILCSLSLLLAFSSLNFTSLHTFAIDSKNWDNNWNQDDYSIEEMEIIEEKDALSYQTYLNYKDMLNIQNDVVTRLMPVTYTYTIDVDNFIQEETNWCGPACIRQTLSFHKNYSNATFSLPSQTEIAIKVGVYGNNNGSSTDVMKSTLNTYLEDFGIAGTYISADINDKSLEWVYSIIKTEIEQETYAPIVLIDTNDPYGPYEYIKDGIKIRHYNTISGVEEVIDGNLNKLLERNVYRVDPHYNDNYSGTYLNSFVSIHSSMEYADSHGSNKVFIY